MLSLVQQNNLASLTKKHVQVLQHKAVPNKITAHSSTVIRAHVVVQMAIVKHVTHLVYASVVDHVHLASTLRVDSVLALQTYAVSTRIFRLQILQFATNPQSTHLEEHVPAPHTLLQQEQQIVEVITTTSKRVSQLAVQLFKEMIFTLAKKIMVTSPAPYAHPTPICLVPMEGAPTVVYQPVPIPAVPSPAPTYRETVQISTSTPR